LIFCKIVKIGSKVDKIIEICYLIFGVENQNEFQKGGFFMKKKRMGDVLGQRKYNKIISSMTRKTRKVFLAIARNYRMGVKWKTLWETEIVERKDLEKIVESLKRKGIVKEILDNYYIGVLTRWPEYYSFKVTDEELLRVVAFYDPRRKSRQAVDTFMDEVALQICLTGMRSSAGY
jgi:arginyl-tRNA synthetase